MSEATRHGLRRFLTLLLIAGTLFGGWQAYRKNQFDRQRESLVSQQASLIAREDAFRVAFQSDKVARVMVNAEGKITGATVGAVKLANIPENEIIGQTLESLALVGPVDSRRLTDPPIGKTFRIPEVPLNRRDKTPVDVEARSTSIGEGHGAIISFDRTRSVVELPAAAE